MKKSHLLLWAMLAFVLVLSSCTNTCHCVYYDENGKVVGEDEQTVSVSNKCSSLNEVYPSPDSKGVKSVYCDGTKPLPPTPATDNVIVIDGVKHTFDENGATETDTSLCLNFFEEHPVYMTTGWGTICMDKQQIGKKVLIKDLKNFSFGWFKNPAEGYNEENAFDYRMGDFTDDSYVTVTRLDNGDFAAELNAKTKDGKTINGRVICKP